MKNISNTRFDHRCTVAEATVSSSRIISIILDADLSASISIISIIDLLSSRLIADNIIK